MSCPPASIANTSPPETIGAVSSRRRLASPSPRSTDQISCGTGLSAGLSSRLGRAPLRFGQSAFVTAPGIGDRPRPRRARRRRLVRPHRDTLARKDRILVAAAASASASASAATGARHPHPLGPRLPPSPASAVDRHGRPAARSTRRRRGSAAAPAIAAPRWRSAPPARRCRSAIAAAPVARLEPHQRPLLERQRPERRVGRDQPLERRLALGGVHRRAEQHHPLQAPRASARSAPPRRRRPPRRAARAAPSRSPAASRLPACASRASTDARGFAAAKAPSASARAAGVRLGERRGQRVAGGGRRRPLPRLPPGVEGRAADEQQHHRGDQPAIAPQRGEEPVAADLLADLADEGITLVHAQRLRAPSAV